VRICFLLWLPTTLWGCHPPATSPDAEPSPLPTATLIPLNPPDFATLAPPTAAISRLTPTPLPSPTPLPTPEPRRHTVVAGDSIWSIAARNGLTPAELLALNPQVRPELLAIGQELLLPAAETVPAAGNVAEAPLPVGLELVTLRLFSTPTGSWWVLGEVRNSGPTAVVDVRVTVSISGAAGEEPVTWHAWLQPGLLAPESQAPFGMLVADLPPPPHTLATLISAGHLLHTAHDRRRAVQGQVVTLTQENNRVRWEGTLRNSSELPLEALRVVLVCHDAEGQPVGFTEMWPEGVLAAGEERAISAELILPVSGTRVISYYLLAEGRTLSPP
jgi:LysM repeat protein